MGLVVAVGLFVLVVVVVVCVFAAMLGDKDDRRS
jgi:hypothetical protein